MWMALEVILLHRMSWKGYDNLIFRFLKNCELFSVPVFMIIAFYLSAKTIEEQDPEKVRNRFIRLIIPQVGWAIICWTVYVLTDIIFMHKLSHTLLDLLIAIISGCRQDTNPSTWFQCVLIILTAIYCLVFKLCKRETAWKCVYASFVVALLIQASGFYFDFFADKPYEIMNTIGRIFEVMPFASVGMILRHINVYEKLKDKRSIVIVASLVLFIIGFYIPFPQFKGFFEGLYPIYMGIMLFIFFLFLPLEDVTDKSRSIILQVTRYTLGIYCAHRLVYGIMEIIYELLGLNIPNFSRCLLTYLACYVMSFVFTLLPGNFFRKMVD